MNKNNPAVWVLPLMKGNNLETSKLFLSNHGFKNLITELHGNATITGNPPFGWTIVERSDHKEVLDEKGILRFKIRTVPCPNFIEVTLCKF